VDILEDHLQGRTDQLSGVLPQAMEVDVRSRLGIARPGCLVSAACASSTIALARAAMSIAQGSTEAAIVVCADLVTEFVFSGFSSLRALSVEPCRPFDRSRKGLSLGEGGAALLLMSEDRVRREGRPILGEIAGFGVACDAVHITAPARDGCGLIAAVKLAMGRAGIGPEDIGAVSAHGTGTVYNDLMELTAFRAVFGGRKLPVHSVKGALGHTMGAAGGIETVLGLMSLKQNLIPGTRGCETPEPMAEGWVSQACQSFSGDYLLTTNSGFGGINAALVLQRQGAS
jgi:3-oxoacyl-[acyl-carrier-protein] synthase II